MSLPAWLRRPWVALAIVLACAAWVQCITARETHVPVPGGPDAGSYVSYAYNLRQFGTYSRERTWKQSVPQKPRADAISTPGYPLLLIPFLGDRPDLDFLARVVRAQALLGILTVLVVVLLGREVGGWRVGLAAGLLSALTPHLATINTYLLTEGVFAFLLLLSLLGLAWAMKAGGAWRWAFVGLVFGACCLVRPTLQALVPIVALVAAAAPGRRRRMRSPAWFAALLWLAVMLPWFAYKHSVPPSPDQPDLFRATLYHGSFPDFRYGNLPAGHGTPYRDDPNAADSMASTAGLVRNLERRAAAEPLRYLRWYLVGKAASFLAWDNTPGGDHDVFIYYVDASPWFDRPTFRIVHALMYGLHAPLMIAGFLGALLGMFAPRRLCPGGHPEMLRALAGVALAAVLFHMIGAPYPRYGIPFWPLFYVLGTLLLMRLGRAVMAHRKNAATRPGVAHLHHDASCH